MSEPLVRKSPVKYSADYSQRSMGERETLRERIVQLQAAHLVRTRQLLIDLLVLSMLT